MKQQEGVLSHSTLSPTAATVGNRLFGESGVMTYRVTIKNGDLFIPVDVDAATGDDAAAKAIAKAGGGKVTHVEPAPQSAQTAEAE